MNDGFVIVFAAFIFNTFVLVVQAGALFRWSGKMEERVNQHAREIERLERRINELP